MKVVDDASQDLGPTQACIVIRPQHYLKMSINKNLVRNVIMIKEDLIYKPRTDLEDQETSKIWIELK